jgi:hypothetical protein
MQLTTKFGSFSIVQAEPPDDGDAAVYHVRSPAREALEKLSHEAGLPNQILTSENAGDHYHIATSQRDIFALMSALAESIDYKDFPAPGDRPGQPFP